jgi:hypothetical protein
MKLMTDTKMTDDWIAKAIKDNPIVLLESGNYRTCPVRLSFPNLFTRSKPIAPAVEGSYGANLIFPVGADRSLLEAAVVDVLRDKCPDALSEDPKKRVKFKNPFKDQDEMLKYDGYCEGGFYISATSRQNKPPVVDAKGAVITDESKVYPGVWAVCTIRPFWYDKGVNKGISFGLQSVMIVADDNNLGGGGENLANAFAGVNIDAGSVDTSALFA